MLVRETGVHSLLIDPLSQNDAGTYTCLATNKTGQNSFSLELTVVGKNHWKTGQNAGVKKRELLTKNSVSSLHLSCLGKMRLLIISPENA